MVKIIATLAIGIGLPVAALLVYAATRPDTFRVERAASIKAPADKIFPLLEDFRRFVSWSPYETRDPGMKRTYGGAPSGKGAVYEWDGDSNVGQGRMEIAEASPPSRLTLTFDMVRPFAAHNIIEFTLEPHGDATIVTWSMQGPVPFPAKILHVFVNMDRMVGGDFETGLANLKAIVEQQQERAGRMFEHDAGLRASLNLP